MRRRAWLPILPLAAAGGCTCGRAPSNTVDAGSSASAVVSAAPLPSASAVAASTAAPLDAAVFSAPIAAVRADDEDVVVGLVATSATVRVMALRAGAPAWAMDVLHDVAWTPDADLSIQRSPDGFVLVWHGMRAGKTGRTLVQLGLHGETRQAPREVGSTLCVTRAGAAWLDSRAGGATRLAGRGWGEAASRRVATVPVDRDPELVCGDQAVMMLGDGDDDLTMTSFVPGDATASAPQVVARDADFGADDEREHDAYTVGDDLGIVRIGSSGAVSVRQIPRGGTPGPWKKLKHTIPEDDDVVAVDGDASVTMVVFTEDAEGACPGVGSAGERVRAIRVDAKSGDDVALDLAPAACDRTPGPFWIAPAPQGPVVAWVDHASGATGAGAPILGASFRTITTEGVRERRIEQAADALVDAGCDARGCSFAALVRPEAGDGMQPEKIVTVPYP